MQTLVDLSTCFKNIMEKEVKIGLALGGGGAKGPAHIGVLKVFEQYGLKIHRIMGTSAGSTFAGLHALGYNSDEILVRSKGLNSKKFVKFYHYSFFGDSLIKDRNINNILKDMFGKNTFKDTKIPFSASAVDLEDGQEVLIEDGYLWQACRASAAIPFLFKPMYLNGRYLVDGGLLNNVPVDHLREKGDCDVIIGVELGGMTSRQYISGMIWQKYYKKPETFKLEPGFLTKLKMNTTLMSHILLRSLDILRETSQKIRFDIAKPDIIIHPKVDNISLLESSRFMEAYNYGIQAAQEAMPTILSIIQNKRTELYKNPENGTLTTESIS